MQTEFIPYRELRPFAGLAADYAADFSRVAGYYSANPASLSDLKRCAATALKFARPREAVAHALAEYNRRLGADEKALANAAMLARPDWAAVVTGQQPGLAGGPLFTFYKAFTAIKLARFLCEKGVPCVPIFWNASDGHDVSEYAALPMTLEEGTIEKRLKELPEAASAFDVKVTLECLSLLAEYRAALPETEFRDEVAERILSVYEGNLAESFSRLVLRLLAGTGLILMEPRLLRRETARLIAREIETGGESSGLIRDAAARLKAAGYEPPFTGEEGVKALLYEDGKRRHHTDAKWFSDARARVCGAGIAGDA